jgi:hypothetical protein
MCEYDAIEMGEERGHGHGHNIQAPAVCTAAILIGAKALAGSSYDLCSDPALLAEVRREFEAALEENPKG